MPAWSTEIAAELIRMASADGKAFDQMHVQELVYIAHGWCLALTGQPLTGDRPEALEHGPEYRRLADALCRSGVDPLDSENAWMLAENATKTDATHMSESALNAEENSILARTYVDYGGLPTTKLATLTRADDTPWARVHAGGAGSRHDISHALIREQFITIAAKRSR